MTIYESDSYSNIQLSWIVFRQKLGMCEIAELLPHHLPKKRFHFPAEIFPLKISHAGIRCIEMADIRCSLTTLNLTPPNS